MNISESGNTDFCEQSLRVTLSTSPDLAPHNRRHLEKALDWYNGDADEPLSLLDCLIVVRLTNNDFAVKLTSDSDARFLKFDTGRNRVIVIDPEEMNPVPVEETDITPFFEDAVISFTSTAAIQQKTFTAVTAVTHPDRGTKLVLGKYPDEFVEVRKNGEIAYESKTMFELPREMTQEEIDEWLHSPRAEDVREIVQTNHDRNWATASE